MMISMECLVLAVFLMIGLLNGIQGQRTQESLLFRATTSTLQYVFPKTETSTEVVVHFIFSTSKCGGKILVIPSRDTQQHYYAFKLEPSGKLFFEYNILDGKFALELNTTRTDSFCDGRKHSIYLRRLHRDVYYRVDSGDLEHVEQEKIQKPSLSKPDGVFIGGDVSDKFFGCIYNASVMIHWSKLPESTIDLVQMYLNGDHKVSANDLFIDDVCVDRSAECKPLRTRLHVTRPSGIIAGPAPKDNITVCTWLLTAPKQHRVKLTFLLLRVNDFLACQDNHVEVLEGKNIGSQMIGRYCNPKITSVPKPIYSVGRHLTVVLNINPSKKFDFVAKYTSVDLSEGPCPVRAELRGKRGTFSTPNYPHIHGNSKLCTWAIDIPRGMHVLITFKRNDFHIEGCSVDCKCDFLEVWTESDGRQDWYGKYCGFIRPSPIYITGEKILAKFFSDSQESRRGFRAEYTIIDSVQNHCFSYTPLKNSSGVITSPRFPLPYPGQMDCLWAIKGPPYSRVKLTFMSPLYLDFNCTDYLEVTDAARKSSQTFRKRLCMTSNVLQPIISGGRDLFLRFVSDKYQQLSRKKTGFMVKYKVLQGSAMENLKGSGVASLSANISLLAIFIIMFLAK